MKKLISILFVFLLTAGVVFLGGCDEKKATYDISTYIYGARFGDVYGGNGTYNEGDSVTVKAVPRATINTNNENVFVAWIHDNRVVSFLPEYTFIVDANASGEYIALFQNNSTDLEYISIVGYEIMYGEFVNEQGLGVEVTGFDVSIGYQENILFKIIDQTGDNFIGSSDMVGESTDNMYVDEDDYPYVYNKVEDLFIKINIYYSRDDFKYVSTAMAKIDGVGIGEIPTIMVSEQFSNAILSGDELELEFETKPSFSLVFSVLEPVAIEEEQK